MEHDEINAMNYKISVYLKKLKKCEMQSIYRRRFLPQLFGFGFVAKCLRNSDLPGSGGSTTCKS